MKYPNNKQYWFGKWCEYHCCQFDSIYDPDRRDLPVLVFCNLQEGKEHDHEGNCCEKWCPLGFKVSRFRKWKDGRRKKFEIRISFKWYDIWIGAYWDRRGKILYICPLPMIVLEFSYHDLEQRFYR